MACDNPKRERGEDAGSSISAPTAQEAGSSASTPIGRQDVVISDAGGRTPQAKLGAIEIKGAPIKNGVSLVLGMKSGIRACYKHALIYNANQRGDVRLEIQVGPLGRVVRAQALGGEAISDELRGCLVRRAQVAFFDPPDGGRTTISVPIHFEWTGPPESLYWRDFGDR
jgi:hypothetical protein